MIQDLKHSLNTFWNNLFSIACLLTLGSYTPIYHHIKELAYNVGTSLYHCDIHKLDRQNTARLFSAATLVFLLQHYPDYLREIVYLFIFGEWVDAHQNQEITHQEHIQIILWAQYSTDYWQSYLEGAGYSEKQYLISREWRYNLLSCWQSHWSCTGVLQPSQRQISSPLAPFKQGVWVGIWRGSSDCQELHHARSLLHDDQASDQTLWSCSLCSLTKFQSLCQQPLSYIQGGNGLAIVSWIPTYLELTAIYPFHLVFLCTTHNAPALPKMLPCYQLCPCTTKASDTAYILSVYQRYWSWLCLPSLMYVLLALE